MAVVIVPGHEGARDSTAVGEKAGGSSEGGYGDINDIIADDDDDDDDGGDEDKG